MSIPRYRARHGRRTAHRTGERHHPGPPRLGTAGRAARPAPPRPRGRRRRLVRDRPGTGRIYAPDLRGHGRSDWPGDYAYATLRDDVHALLGALGIARADVVGHSLGGAVAYLLAQHSPHLVRRLVLKDVPAPFPLDPPRPLAERPGRDLSYDWAMILATDRQRNAPDPVWWDHMGRITMPTLLIGGGPASPIPQKQIAAFAELLPDARRITIDAGHLVHEARPEEFLVAVEEFLSPADRTPS
ncbi:alpha/beta fold hydrolase [Streptomyces sp. CA-179760]|uniref:alpha/beta fold hydrolase n=1 Tax=Streptomyces sp. CA-179760 TaxID=3240054 RepID=UPI003D8A92B9